MVGMHAVLTIGFALLHSQLVYGSFSLQEAASSLVPAGWMGQEPARRLLDVAPVNPPSPSDDNDIPEGYVPIEVRSNGNKDGTHLILCPLRNELRVSDP